MHIKNVIYKIHIYAMKTNKQFSSNWFNYRRLFYININVLCLNRVYEKIPWKAVKEKDIIRFKEDGRLSCGLFCEGNASCDLQVEQVSISWMELDKLKWQWQYRFISNKPASQLPSPFFREKLIIDSASELFFSLDGWWWLSLASGSSHYLENWRTSYTFKQIQVEVFNVFIYGLSTEHLQNFLEVQLVISQCIKMGWGLLGLVPQKKKKKKKLLALDINFGLLGHFQEYRLIHCVKCTIKYHHQHQFQ